jgi:hypothetical protein
MQVTFQVQSHLPVTSRHERMEALRARRHEREMQLQESENERIMKINKQMERVTGRIGEIRDKLNKGVVWNAEAEEYQEVDKAALTQELEARRDMIDMLADKIAHIYEQRGERETRALEQEARELQARFEERIREREEEAEEAAERQSSQPKAQEEIEQAAERDFVRSLARNDFNKGVIHRLAHVRGARSLEALQLRHAIKNDGGWGFDDFRVNHLQKLDESIARMDVAITARVADMYKQSLRQGEALKEMNTIPEEEIE